MEQYPTTGQNPYGQPPPTYPPQYPDTGQSPYGAPPQQGYLGTAPFGQQPTGYNVPPRQRRNNRIIIGVVVGVVLLVVVGIIHVNSATGMVKGFYDDLFSYNATSASARLCLDAPARFKTGVATLEYRLSPGKGQATFDLSHVVYTLTSGGLTSAVVKVTGTITGVANNGNVTTNPAALGNNRNESDYQVNLSGLGWCVYNEISTPAPPSG